MMRSSRNDAALKSYKRERNACVRCGVSKILIKTNIGI